MLASIARGTRGGSLRPWRSIVPVMKPDPNQSARVLTWEQTAAFANNARSAGRRIVFPTGVFDPLPPGRVRSLLRARSLGDLLIVGLNGDASVRRNRGPARPVTPEYERAELLAALECVDAVFIFEQDPPAEIVRLV